MSPLLRYQAADVAVQALLAVRASPPPARRVQAAFAASAAPRPRHSSGPVPAFCQDPRPHAAEPRCRLLAGPMARRRPRWPPPSQRRAAVSDATAPSVRVIHQAKCSAVHSGVGASCAEAPDAQPQSGCAQTRRRHPRKRPPARCAPRRRVR
eukprot:scaffold43945_cov24-Tisochrysis_lutea.AAC.1